MAILPVLQLPRYQGSDPSVLQCIKVLNASLSRKQSLAVLRLNCERERCSKLRKLFREMEN